MDLTSRAIREVIHPTAAHNQEQSPRDESQGQHALEQQPAEESWEESQLNPKNRIDSLDPLGRPLWLVHGCTGLGTQYYVSPSSYFLADFPPMRYDVFIAEKAAESPELRSVLDLDKAFHTKDPERLGRLGVTNFILRTLQYLSANGVGLFGKDAVKNWPTTKPFGSRIIFEKLAFDIRNVRVIFTPTHYLEKQLEALSALRNIWRDSVGGDWPRQIDINELRSVRRLHDSVNLVTVLSAAPSQSTSASLPRPQRPPLWIFKAMTSNPKYLYHELKSLMVMPPHPNIVSRPEYLVCKRGLFGNRSLVVGFLLPYHPGGNLSDVLPLKQAHNQLRLDDQLNWSIQLTEALIHSREEGKTFYPDLRLENIVLSEDNNIVMVDFEQRGVWCEFAAPEINALQYLLILAEDVPPTDVDPDYDAETGTQYTPAAHRQRFRDLFSNLLPPWALLQGRETYLNVRSFNVPWLCLGAAEQEAAEVYMLGRVLWCVFEGACAPQRGAIWQSYAREPGYEFPEYRHTPGEMRALIDECTRGRREPLGSRIIRERSRLVLRRPGSEGESVAKQSGEEERQEIRRVAKEFWEAEVKAAEDYVARREAIRNASTWQGHHFGRPTLREVLERLVLFQNNKQSSSPAQVHEADLQEHRPGIIT